MEESLSSEALSRLERLRRIFLSETEGQGDYWSSEADLTAYDQTFARRIGWKWDCLLSEPFHIVAPCTHQSPCGLVEKREWCHQFAPPPPNIFSDREWVRFARRAGIDLRSLPMSFLVLHRRTPPPLPKGSARMIGWSRAYKGHALITGCDGTGVREMRLLQRKFPALFRLLKKRRHGFLLAWQFTGSDIAALEFL